MSQAQTPPQNRRPTSKCPDYFFISIRFKVTRNRLLTFYSFSLFSFFILSWRKTLEMNSKVFFVYHWFVIHKKTRELMWRHLNPMFSFSHHQPSHENCFFYTIYSEQEETKTVLPRIILFDSTFERKNHWNKVTLNKRQTGTWLEEWMHDTTWLCMHLARLDMHLTRHLF